MTARVLGPTGSPRRRWTLLLPLTLAILVGLFYVAGAQAVHERGLFELDKNATNDLDTTPIAELSSNVTVGAASIVVCKFSAFTDTGDDFRILIEAEEMLVTAVGAAGGGGCQSNTKRTWTVTRAQGGTTAAAHQAVGESADVTLLETVSKDGTDWNEVFEEIDADADSKCDELDLVECTFTNDGAGLSIFDGGASKDHLPIEGWKHKSGSVSDKSNLLNAYAAKGIDEDGHQVVYFGADRLAVDGSVDAGFWFFRNPVVANEDGTFTGEHAGTLTETGDILILTTFSQGGATVTARVFRWVGTGGNEGSGSISGPDGDFGDCVQDPPLTEPDAGCATVNNTTITVPWEYQAKGEPLGGWVPTGGLLEGGVDLTELELDGCFSSFLAETRASPSIPAILEDFVLGEFEACGIGITTSPTDPDDDTATDEIILGDSIYDHAVVQGTGGGPDPTGDVTFFICAPDELDDDAADDDPNTCDVGGTQVGTAVTLDGGTDPDDAQATADSDEFEPDAVGTWCWRGVYSGDDTYDSATDASTGECFDVIDTTSIVTDQEWVPNDTATITSQGGSSLTGSLTFTLYDNDTCTAGTDNVNVLYQEVLTLSGVASGTPQSTTNGDGSGTGLAADEIFVEADSPVGPLSWKAVFNSTTDSMDSEGPCETTSPAFTIDDNDPTP